MQYWVCFTKRLFDSNNFALSAALAEVCALLSVILVFLEISSDSAGSFVTLRRRTFGDFWCEIFYRLDAISVNEPTVPKH